MLKMRGIRWHRWMRTGITLLSLLSIVTGMALVGVLPMPAGASMGDVVRNGSFESGFGGIPGCGLVGNGWSCFTNGGLAGYGFYDDEWEPVVGDGEHSQLIEVNTKGLVQGDADRYAGIYQTVKVEAKGKYKLHLRGMIRTTNHEGDPYRYVVQVGWTSGKGADWQRVQNWQDVGWYEYFDRVEPGYFSDYTAMITAPAEQMTLYVRVWKKWGVPFEEIDVNLDAISLTGVKPMGGMKGQPMGEGAMGLRPGKPGMERSMMEQPMMEQPMMEQPMMEQPVMERPMAPMEPKQQVVCGGESRVYNGGFEHGFNPTGIGHVGRGWGSFTNGGLAAYGFYDEMWEPVISSGEHGQLIEINTKGFLPADGDRYAGIYQKIGHLEVGKSYELVVRGMLRGDGGEGGDPNRFEAQVGYNWGNDGDWRHVGNWSGTDLGEIYPRTEPGNLGTYRVRFKAEAPSMVLFLRGWLKWGETDLEFDLNYDDISIVGCHEQAKSMAMMQPGMGKDGMSKSMPEQRSMGWTAEQRPMQPEMGRGMKCEHVVKPGDSLSAISVHYDVSMAELMKENRLADANLIFIGQKLRIAGCGQPKAESGQSMAQPMKPEEAKGMEPQHPSMGLRGAKPGMEQPMMVAGYTHTVRAGETLSGICAQYGADPQAVVRMNGIANANFIYVGQELVLP